MTSGQVPPTRTAWERMAAPLAGLSAGAFAALSALRRNRVFHPVGEAYTANLQWAAPENAPEALRIFDGSHDVLVRFSRGAGVPEPMPDVLGIAIKIPASDRLVEQDILLASCGAPPVARNLLLPARSFLRCTYSTVLPYRAGDRSFLFGARANKSLANRKGDFGDIDRAATEAILLFHLFVASLTGDWTEVATLQIGAARPQSTAHSLRFNPWNTQPGIEPAGPLNTLRLSTYRASQKARPTTEV